LGSWTERDSVADVVGSAGIHYVFLETDGNTKERWECLFLVIPIPPAFFLVTILPNLIDFLCFLESRFKKLIDDVIIFDSNAGRSFDEDEAYSIGSVFSLIHEPCKFIGG